MHTACDCWLRYVHEPQFMMMQCAADPSSSITVASDDTLIGRVGWSMVSNSRKNQFGFGRWNDFVVMIWSSLAVHLNDDSKWWLSNRQTDGLASFWFVGWLMVSTLFQKYGTRFSSSHLSWSTRTGFVVNAQIDFERRWNDLVLTMSCRASNWWLYMVTIESSDPLIWRRFDLEGVLANGKHIFPFLVKSEGDETFRFKRFSIVLPCVYMTILNGNYRIVKLQIASSPIIYHFVGTCA